MSRRKVTGRRQFPSRRLYLGTFAMHAAMKERIEVILDLGFDPAPGSSNSPQLEHALTALAEGKPEPLEMTTQLNGAVERAIGQLFHLRDRET